MSPTRFAIDTAITASCSSLCRSKRGVCIYTGDFLLATGFNHQPGRLACDGSELCKSTCRYTAVHAEAAALLRCAFPYRLVGSSLVHIKTVNGVPVPSEGPSCLPCACLILEARIGTVWLLLSEGWHSYDAAEFHRLSVEAFRDKNSDPQHAK